MIDGQLYPNPATIEVSSQLGLKENYYDIYIRMKDSPDNDICFQIQDNKTTFNDLIKIFEVIPIVFSPSIFYEKVPIGFSISFYPGFLTRTGGILFEQESGNKKYLKKIDDLNDHVSDHCLPGQLIIPIFKKRTLLHQGILLSLAAWLYTDLPDFISPTPGICFTNYASLAIVYLFRYVLNRPVQAQKFYDDIFEPVGIVGQCIYFAFHIFKVLLLYFILWSGSFNPYSWTKQPKLHDINKEKLVDVGWTGAIKLQKPQYQDEYRNFLISKFGSFINVYKAGKLSYVKECVIPLEDGEGYSSNSGIKVSDELDHPFILTKELLLREFKHVKNEISRLPIDEAWVELKRYRRTGTTFTSSRLQKLVDLRFARINRRIAEQEVRHNLASIFKKTD